MTEQLTVNVRKCSRCGGDHDQLKFSRFTTPQEDTPYDHWAMCPEINEPILLQIVKKTVDWSNPIKIKRWLRDGHSALSADGLEDTNDLLESAGRGLDSACSHDIMGEVVFEGEDGKFYVGCVEFDISEANADYIKDVLAEIEKEG